MLCAATQAWLSCLGWCADGRLSGIVALEKGQRAIEQELLLNTKLSMLWEAVWVLNPRAWGAGNWNLVAANAIKTRSRLSAKQAVGALHDLARRLSACSR